MIVENDLFQLVAHYHLENADNCFENAINVAEKELQEVLNTEREWPPFIYYLCLMHMQNNPKYKFGKTFNKMNNDEKTIVFNETIEALRNLLK